MGFEPKQTALKSPSELEGYFIPLVSELIEKVGKYSLFCHLLSVKIGNEANQR